MRDLDDCLSECVVCGEPCIPVDDYEYAVCMSCDSARDFIPVPLDLEHAAL